MKHKCQATHGPAHILVEGVCFELQVWGQETGECLSIEEQQNVSVHEYKL
jgi:hypothetical protein